MQTSNTLFALTVAGPTLDDITNAHCPDHLPYKCLPYGVCYNHESYCSQKSRTAEPCFPSELLGKETELFSWCQRFAQGQELYLPDQSCLFACFHRFNATELLGSKQNSFMITRLQTELIVIISVLVNWMVCGTILLVMVTYCKPFRSYLITVQASKLWKLPTKKRGHVTRTHFRRAVEGSYTEQGEGIELQPINPSNNHKMSSPLKDSQKADETPETAINKLQVVLNEYDINIKTHPSLQLHRRQGEDPRHLAFPMIENNTEASVRPDDESNLLDDVDLSNVVSQRIAVREELGVWHE